MLKHLAFNDAFMQAGFIFCLIGENKSFFYFNVMLLIQIQTNIDFRSLGYVCVFLDGAGTARTFIVNEIRRQ